MNRYLYIFLFLCLFTIITFAIFEATGLTFDGLLQHNAATPAVALTSVLLLGVDVVLPIPSSVVMIGNGVLFGAWLGGLLSIVGGMVASVAGYWLGAKSKKLADKVSSQPDEQRAKTFLEKYGYLAIVASRPIPVLAESVSIICGTLRMDFRKVVLSSLVGLVPISLIYSFTGAYSTSIDSGVWAFVLNLGIAAFIWVLTTWRKKTK